MYKKYLKYKIKYSDLKGGSLSDIPNFILNDNDKKIICTNYLNFFTVREKNNLKIYRFKSNINSENRKTILIYLFQQINLELLNKIRKQMDIMLHGQQSEDYTLEDLERLKNSSIDSAPAILLALFDFIEHENIDYIYIKPNYKEIVNILEKYFKFMVGVSLDTPDTPLTISRRSERR